MLMFPLLVAILSPLITDASLPVRLRYVGAVAVAFNPPAQA